MLRIEAQWETERRTEQNVIRILSISSPCFPIQVFNSVHQKLLFKEENGNRTAPSDRNENSN